MAAQLDYSNVLVSQLVRLFNRHHIDMFNNEEFENTNIEKICEALLKHKDVDVTSNNNEAILQASEHGYTNIIKLLLENPNVDPTINNNQVFINICNNCQCDDVCTECDDTVNKCNCNKNDKNIYAKFVEMLLKNPKVDPSAQDNKAIINACFSCEGCNKTNLGIIKLLLDDPRVDPSTQDNRAIVEASDYDTIKLLLDDIRVNPSARNNIVLFNAYKNKDDRLIELLLKDSRIKISQDELQTIIDASLIEEQSGSESESGSDSD